MSDAKPVHVQVPAGGERMTISNGRLHVPDHPIIPMIPETEYLKGFAFEKVR